MGLKCSQANDIANHVSSHKVRCHLIPARVRFIVYHGHCTQRFLTSPYMVGRRK